MESFIMVDLKWNLVQMLRKVNLFSDLTNKALAFQIGANTTQTVFIDVPELSTVKLGIDGLSVMSHEKANDAIFRT